MRYITPYLRPEEAGLYGIADAPETRILAASRLVDAKLGRPDGLLWAPDANGNPAWMANRTATRSYSLAAPTSAGLNTIAVANASFGQGDVGVAVVIDRSNPAAAETCIIVAATGNTITLAAQFAHNAGATIEYGLTIAEEAAVRHGGMVGTNARPLAALLSVTGSYRGGRRDRGRYSDRIEELLAVGTDYDAWDSFPVDQCDVDATTGICWMLPGTVRGGFARVRLNYVAGWSYATLPAAIKQATANLVANMAFATEIPTNLKSSKAGDATLVNFNSSLFDSDTESLLMPYRNVRI